MSKITVKAKIDGGTHLKYGEIKAGQKYEIDPEDFGEELFERPKGFESPHEKADRERREENERAEDRGPGTEENPEPRASGLDSEATEGGN